MTKRGSLQNQRLNAAIREAQLAEQYHEKAFDARTAGSEKRARYYTRLAHLHDARSEEWYGKAAAS